VLEVTQAFTTPRTF